MSYEYHGYDYVPETISQYVHVRQIIYEKGKSRLYDDYTYNELSTILDNWIQGIASYEHVYVDSIRFQLRSICNHEVDRTEIKLIGRYIYVPYLDLMIEVPAITAIETAMELLKL